MEVIALNILNNMDCTSGHIEELTSPIQSVFGEELGDYFLQGILGKGENIEFKRIKAEYVIFALKNWLTVLINHPEFNDMFNQMIAECANLVVLDEDQRGELNKIFQMTLYYLFRSPKENDINNILYRHIMEFFTTLQELQICNSERDEHFAIALLVNLFDTLIDSTSNIFVKTIYSEIQIHLQMISTNFSAQQELIMLKETKRKMIENNNTSQLVKIQTRMMALNDVLSTKSTLSESSIDDIYYRADVNTTDVNTTATAEVDTTTTAEVYTTLNKKLTYDMSDIEIVEYIYIYFNFGESIVNKKQSAHAALLNPCFRRFILNVKDLRDLLADKNYAKFLKYNKFPIAELLNIFLNMLCPSSKYYLEGLNEHNSSFPDKSILRTSIEKLIVVLEKGDLYIAEFIHLYTSIVIDSILFTKKENIIIAEKLDTTTKQFITNFDTARDVHSILLTAHKQSIQIIGDIGQNIPFCIYLIILEFFQQGVVSPIHNPKKYILFINKLLKDKKLLKSIKLEREQIINNSFVDTLIDCLDNDDIHLTKRIFLINNIIYFLEQLSMLEADDLLDDLKNYIFQVLYFSVNSKEKTCIKKDTLKNLKLLLK